MRRKDGLEQMSRKDSENERQIRTERERVGGGGRKKQSEREKIHERRRFYIQIINKTKQQKQLRK